MWVKICKFELDPNMQLQGIENLDDHVGEIELLLAASTLRQRSYRKILQHEP